MAVHFVMGHDTVVRFLDPKYYQGDRDEDGVPSGLKVFFEKHQGRIVVAPRTAEDGASSIIIPVCLSNYISEMDPLDTATMLVSSTRVRNAIQCGNLDAVKQLVTPSVYKLLTQN
ncbi:hypothetical protein GQ42DRAFT_161351 [Ramicandelaber brevisporus]|nr:hypothetical protein GQ42DRAFT_161351 [Ramicandelaber brevisporus]